MSNAELRDEASRALTGAAAALEEMKRWRVAERREAAAGFARSAFERASEAYQDGSAPALREALRYSLKAENIATRLTRTYRDNAATTARDYIAKAERVISRIQLPADQYYAARLCSAEDAIEKARRSVVDLDSWERTQEALSDANVAWQLSRAVRALVENRDSIEAEVRSARKPMVGCFGIGCGGLLLTAIVAGMIGVGSEAVANVVTLGGFAASCIAGLLYRSKKIALLRLEREEATVDRFLAETERG